MELNKEQVFKILGKKHYVLNQEEMINLISTTKNYYFSFLDILFNKKITGLENIENCNPLLWEAYHPIWFIKKMCLSYFQNIDLSKENLIYDSFICSRKYRFEKSQLYNINSIVENVHYCFSKLLEIPINASNSYLILLSILHLHMHLESYLFTRKRLYLDKFNFPIKLDKNLLENLEYVNIVGGNFTQGNDESKDPIVFDNELPNFKNQVSDFLISKTYVTNYIYFKFIKNQGYNNSKYWSEYGWKYIQENKINSPLYWKQNSDKQWLIYFNNEWVYINQIHNYPITHISWWEAEAFCNWCGGRLPKEAEWEYIASKSTLTNANINYKNGIVSVLNNTNSDLVHQVFGNVWEWCQEPIYPYDGFKIDPVYREFSYPFFGFKKICRGGSWATPTLLVNKGYRNAQMPDCRYQYISFRVCKDL
tara:strand:+ start:4777 stop:6042 length:1266 start_codon:yes stop_codon:yes gene_type:complete